jgi:hypothetical protein
MEEHDSGGMLAAMVGSVTPIDNIGKMVNIGTLLAFVMVCVSIVVLRFTAPDQPRPFRTPGIYFGGKLPIVPALGIAFNLTMMISLGNRELDSPGRVADYWDVCLFLLFAEAQQGAGAAGFDSGDVRAGREWVHAKRPPGWAAVSSIGGSQFLADSIFRKLELGMGKDADYRYRGGQG